MEPVITESQAFKSALKVYSEIYKEYVVESFRQAVIRSRYTKPYTLNNICQDKAWLLLFLYGIETNNLSVSELALQKFDSLETVKDMKFWLILEYCSVPASLEKLVNKTAEMRKSKYLTSESATKIMELIVQLPQKSNFRLKFQNVPNEEASYDEIINNSTYCLTITNIKDILEHKIYEALKEMAENSKYSLKFTVQSLWPSKALFLIFLYGMMKRNLVLIVPALTFFTSIRLQDQIESNDLATSIVNEFNFSQKDLMKAKETYLDFRNSALSNIPPDLNNIYNTVIDNLKTQNNTSAVASVPVAEILNRKYTVAGPPTSESDEIIEISDDEDSKENLRAMIARGALPGKRSASIHPRIREDILLSKEVVNKVRSIHESTTSRQVASNEENACPEHVADTVAPNLENLQRKEQRRLSEGNDLHIDTSKNIDNLRTKENNKRKTSSQESSPTEETNSTADQNLEHLKIIGNKKRKISPKGKKARVRRPKTNKSPQSPVEENNPPEEFDNVVEEVISNFETNTEKQKSPPTKEKKRRGRRPKVKDPDEEKKQRGRRRPKVKDPDEEANPPQETSDSHSQNIINNNTNEEKKNRASSQEKKPRARGRPPNKMPKEKALRKNNKSKEPYETGQIRRSKRILQGNTIILDKKKVTRKPKRRLLKVKVDTPVLLEIKRPIDRKIESNDEESLEITNEKENKELAPDKEILSNKDYSKKHLLHFAVRMGLKKALFKILMNKSTKVNEKWGGQTALHLAVKKREMDIIQTLIEIGKANVNAKTDKGQTPLHIACQSSSINIVKYLVEKGSSLIVKDIYGNTPAKCCLSNEKGNLILAYFKSLKSK